MTVHTYQYVSITYHEVNVVSYKPQLIFHALLAIIMTQDEVDGSHSYRRTRQHTLPHTCVEKAGLSLTAETFQ